MSHFVHSIENVLYPVKSLDPPHRSREMKVLALGLSRSGTDSLRAALEILGYDHVYHGFDVPSSDPSIRKAWADLGRRKWGPGNDNKPITVDDFDRLLGHCEAVTDQPCACFPLELIEAYPSAKVILNYREVDPWYESIVATFGKLFESLEFQWLSFFDPALYWLKQVFMLYEHGYYQGSMIRNARRIHKEHYATMRGAVPKEKLLEWRVQDGWQPLCTFLDRPVPDVEFPSGNTPTQMFAKGSRLRAEATVRAYRNLGYVGCVMVLLTGVVAAVMGRFLGELDDG